MEVAKATVTAFGQYNPVTDIDQIGDDGFLILIQNLGSRSDAQNDIVTAGTA